LRGGKGGGVKARELWDKDLEELEQMEDDLRHELMSLRVAQQVGGQPGRVNRISMVRKSIARVLTVRTAKRRADVYEKYEKAKYKPYDNRHNKHWTKAMRLRLNKYERERTSLKAIRARKHGFWAHNERPMERLIVKTVKRVIPEDIAPLDMVQIRPRNVAAFPPRKLGQHGKKSGTRVTHIPPHAKKAMERRENKWVIEKKRLKALKESKLAKLAGNDDSE